MSINTDREKPDLEMDVRWWVRYGCVPVMVAIIAGGSAIAAAYVVTATSESPTATPVPTSIPTHSSTDTAVTAAPVTPTPTFTLTASPTPFTPTLPALIGQHVVRDGETLYCIGRAYRVRPDAFAQANDLAPPFRLFPGQVLSVPSVPWENMPDGPRCARQFGSPFPTTPVTPTLRPAVSTPSPTLTLTNTLLGCANFENLQPGPEYKVSETFVNSGVRLTIGSFVWGNGTPTGDGTAYVTAGGAAGGSGLELQINNVNLNFDFSSPLTSLSLLFGEYGGNLNISINGDFRNFANLVDIHGLVIGGVQASVTNGFGNDRGRLQLSGAISSFAIGGQELWIDNVCP